MTRKEKVAEVEPDAIGWCYVGDVEGCPKDYDFLNLPMEEYSDSCIKDCDKCWDTKWSEPVKPKWQQDILDKFMRVI